MAWEERAEVYEGVAKMGWADVEGLGGGNGEGAEGEVFGEFHGLNW